MPAPKPPRRPTPRLITVLAAMALIGAGVVLWWRGDVAPAAGDSRGMGAGPLPVEAVTARTGDLRQTLEVAGQVTANEGVEIKSEIAGRIVKIGFEDGSAVKAGTLLFGLDDSVQRAQLAQAEATLSLAENNVGRQQRLLAQQATSPQLLESAQADAKLARANVQLARANLAKMHLKAPFDGTVGIRAVSLGDYVSSSATLVTLTQNDKLKITLRVPEQQAGIIRPGTTVQILRSNLDEAGAGTAQGVNQTVLMEAPVTAVDGRIDPQTRTLAVLAVVDNADNLLRAGQFVRVAVPTRSATDAVIVPEQAVVPLGGKTFAFVVVPGGNGTLGVTQTLVTVGLRAGGEAEIIHGVRAGQQVVTAGQQKILMGGGQMPVRLVTPTEIVRNRAPAETLK